MIQIILMKNVTQITTKKTTFDVRFKSIGLDRMIKIQGKTIENTLHSIIQIAEISVLSCRCREF